MIKHAVFAAAMLAVGAVEGGYAQFDQWTPDQRRSQALFGFLSSTCLTIQYPTDYEKVLLTRDETKRVSKYLTPEQIERLTYYVANRWQHFANTWYDKVPRDYVCENIMRSMTEDVERALGWPIDGQPPLDDE